jgi:hypothetical protein
MRDCLHRAAADKSPRAHRRAPPPAILDELPAVAQGLGYVQIGEVMGRNRDKLEC